MVDWLQIGQTGGTGDAYVLIQAPDNVSLVERSTTLTVSGFTKHATINVVQQGFEGEITVSPTAITASNVEATAALHITANTSYMVNSKPNWISLSRMTGASGVSTVTATISANTGTTERSGDIVWKCNDFTGTATTHVTQRATVPYFTISPTVINRSSASGTSNVYISTNGTWDITSYSPWFSVSTVAGTSTDTGFTINFPENQTAAELTGTIEVKHNETNTTYTVNVRQYSATTVGIADLVYSASSTSNATKLYNEKGNVVFMEVDGGAIQPATSAVTFSSTGLHNVKLYLNNTQVMPNQFAYSSLVSANLSNINILSNESFDHCNKLSGFTSSTITLVDIGSELPHGYGTSNPFCHCKALTSFHGSSSNVILNGKGFAVSNVLCALAAGYGTSFDTSVLPVSITKLGGGFLTLNLSTNPVYSVNVNSNITELGRLAFFASTITSITFTNSTIQTIPDSCFDSCMRLTSITLPDSVTAVNEMAFNTCTRLTAVTFGSSVQYISYGQNMAPGNDTTFSPIKRITCKSATPPAILTDVGSQSFYIKETQGKSNKNGTVHFPSGSNYSSWQNSEPFVSDGTWTFIADA